MATLPLPEPRDSAERTAVGDAVAAIRNDWGFHERFGFADLLRDWERTVEEVAQGYSLTFENYTRDLAIRDEIAKLMARVPSQLSNRADQWIAPLDATFMQHTVAVRNPVLPPEENEALASWWYRMPASVRPIDLDVAQTWPG